MDEWFRLLTQYLHVFAGILWIGGGFYAALVQLPGVLAAPPAARGPVVAQLAPRQLFYVLRVAEITIATGLLNVVATGRLQQFLDPLAQRWTIVLGLGVLLALVLYGIVRGQLVPLTTRMLALGPKAAGGDAAAAAEVGTIIERLKMLSRVQIVIGALIILAMVTARFS
jgi:uncharacterized membrane protein